MRVLHTTWLLIAPQHAVLILTPNTAYSDSFGRSQHHSGSNPVPAQLPKHRAPAPHAVDAMIESDQTTVISWLCRYLRFGVRRARFGQDGACTTGETWVAQLHALLSVHHGGVTREAHLSSTSLRWKQVRQTCSRRCTCAAYDGSSVAVYTFARW